MISVIVPVYNVEKYLKTCLDSIIAQTESDLEILLIDDGSSDDSGKICDEYSIKDQRIRVFHTDNRGVSAARNLGLLESKGDYIGFVDSDDWIEPTMYEEMLSAIHRTNADVCVCSFIKEFTDRTEIVNNIKDKSYTRKEALRAIALGPFYSYVWNKLVSKDLCKDVLFPEGQIYEDLTVTYKYFLNSHKTISVSTPLYHYRMREGSLVTGLSMNDLKEKWNAYHDKFETLMNIPELAGDKDLKAELDIQSADVAAKTWRWVYEVPKKERDYEHLTKISSYAKNNFPVFGEKGWPLSLRICSFFVRHPNDFSFFLLYWINQIYRIFFKDSRYEG